MALMRPADQRFVRPGEFVLGEGKPEAGARGVSQQMRRAAGSRRLGMMADGAFMATAISDARRRRAHPPHGRVGGQATAAACRR